MRASVDANDLKSWLAIICAVPSNFQAENASLNNWIALCRMGFLNMEIMLSHLGVGMAYDALDGLDIHAQRLHLRHIGVAAAVRREQADIARFF